MKTAATILWTAILTGAGYLYMPITSPAELATMYQHRGHYGYTVDHMRINCGPTPCEHGITPVRRHHGHGSYAGIR